MGYGFAHGYDEIRNMSELQAMPRPSALSGGMPAGMHEEDALEAAIAQSLGLAGSPESNQDYHGPGLDGAALPPEAGVSFANIAKMGFAATGPKLSPGAPEMGECMYTLVLHLSRTCCSPSAYMLIYTDRVYQHNSWQQEGLVAATTVATACTQFCNLPVHCLSVRPAYPMHVLTRENAYPGCWLIILDDGSEAQYANGGLSSVVSKRNPSVRRCCRLP